MRDWTTSPRYQRAVQRMSRMSPEQRAIINTMVLDESFADVEMRKKLQAMQMGAGKEARAKGLELGERALGLKKREFKFAKKMLPIATAIGAAQVGASTYMGLQDIKAAKRSAARRGLITRRYRAY